MTIVQHPVCGASNLLTAFVFGRRSWERAFPLPASLSKPFNMKLLGVDFVVLEASGFTTVG